MNSENKNNNSICLGSVVNIIEDVNVRDNYSPDITDKKYYANYGDLNHTLITGCAKTGKTVLANKIVGKLLERNTIDKPLRVVILDTSSGWNTFTDSKWYKFADKVPSDSISIYSLTDDNIVKINPWKIPKGVRPAIWIDNVLNIFCRCNGLLEGGKNLILEVVRELYEEAGVLKAMMKDDWKETVPELSKSVNFSKIYNRIIEKNENYGGSHVGYMVLLQKLSQFKDTESYEYLISGTSDGVSIDELIEANDITIIGCKSWKINNFKNFIYSVITSGIYEYGLTYENGYFNEKQRETILVVEEAENIFYGIPAFDDKPYTIKNCNTKEKSIMDIARDNGFYIMAITQRLSEIPKLVVDKSNLFIGKTKLPNDYKLIMEFLIDNDVNNIVKHIINTPVGWFTCSTLEDGYNTTPKLVKIDIG